jgi:hypothetical protein
MGGALTGLATGAAAMYWNPAGMASLEHFVGAFSYAALYDELDIDHFYGAAAIPLAGGALGASYIQLSSGDIPRTSEDDPGGGSVEFGQVFSWTASAIGLHYARRLTDRLQVGVSGRIISEGLDQAQTDWWGLDFGTVFKTGFYGITLGAVLANVGPSARMEGNLITRQVTTPEAFPVNLPVRFNTIEYALPTTFRLAVASSLSPSSTSTLNLAVDLNDATDTDLQLSAGLEYGFRELLYLRVGKKWMNDAHADFRSFSDHLSFGGGLARGAGGRRLDYAYTSLADLQTSMCSVRLGGGIPTNRAGRGALRPRLRAVLALVRAAPLRLRRLGWPSAASAARCSSHRSRTPIWYADAGYGRGRTGPTRQAEIPHHRCRTKTRCCCSDQHLARVSSRRIAAERAANSSVSRCRARWPGKPQPRECADAEHEMPRRGVGNARRVRSVRSFRLELHHRVESQGQAQHLRHRPRPGGCGASFCTVERRRSWARERPAAGGPSFPVPHERDALDLDRGAEGQAAGRHRRAGRRVLGEERRVDRVHRRVVGDVPQEHRALDHAVEPAAGVRQHRLDVLHGLPGLPRDPARRQIPGAGHDTDLPGQKKQVADPDGRRER